MAKRPPTICEEGQKVSSTTRPPEKTFLRLNTSLFCRKIEQNPVRVAYERRNRDLDPQLVWRGKDEKDWSDLVVHAPPLYIQEKVHPKALIDDLAAQKPASVSTKPDRPPLIFSLTSTASRRVWTRRSSTSTTRIGRTA